VADVNEKLQMFEAATRNAGGRGCEMAKGTDDTPANDTENSESYGLEPVRLKPSLQKWNAAWSWTDFMARRYRLAAIWMAPPSAL
jgi:hypothetical protein